MRNKRKGEKREVVLGHIWNITTLKHIGGPIFVFLCGKQVLTTTANTNRLTKKQREFLFFFSSNFITFSQKQSPLSDTKITFFFLSLFFFHFPSLFNTIYDPILSNLEPETTAFGNSYFISEYSI